MPKPALLIIALWALSCPAAFGQDLRIITEVYPPYNFTDTGTESGRLTGLSTEIVRAMQQRLGDATPIEVMPWARGYAMALNLPNVMLFSMTWTPEREPLFKWVGPLAAGDQVFFARKGSGVRVACLDDARKVALVGVYREDVGEQFLKARGFANLDSVSNPQLLAKKLAAGRIDLWLSGKEVGVFTARLAGVAPENIEVVYTIEERKLYCAFSRGTPDEVVARWRAAFEDIQADGTARTITEKWTR